MPKLSPDRCGSEAVSYGMLLILAGQLVETGCADFPANLLP